LTPEQRKAFETLVSACEAEFVPDDDHLGEGEYAFEDHEEVASPSSAITFGMIRDARKALSA
jgi:hypothetical protein